MCHFLSWQELELWLRRDFGVKCARIPQIPVLATRVLLRGLASTESWPIGLVEALMEDALNARVWVEHPEAQDLTQNILTAFPTAAKPGLECDEVEAEEEMEAAAPRGRG